MIARAIAAFLPAAVLAAGCNVILDQKELKKGDRCLSNDDCGDEAICVDGTCEEIVADCDGGRLDLRTNLCWQDPKADGSFEWQEAIDYCAGLDRAGHTDWTLPSRDEFIELLGGCDSDVLDGEWGYCDSCDESEACSALFGSDDEWYWSLSPCDSYCAWYVDFDHGYVNGGDVDYGYSVRCVR